MDRAIHGIRGEIRLHRLGGRTVVDLLGEVGTGIGTEIGPVEPHREEEAVAAAVLV